MVGERSEGRTEIRLGHRLRHGLRRAADHLEREGGLAVKAADLRPRQHLQRLSNLRKPAPRAPSLLRGEGLDRLC